LDHVADVVEKHFLHRGQGAEFDMEATWVRRHLPASSGWVLDIGCGIGGLFDTIDLKRVIGVDQCASGLVRTRSLHPSVPLVCADATRLPLRDASFAGVTLQHVMEHLETYRQACGEWFRVLKPGGILLILTPNEGFSDPSVYDDETHVHIFGQRDLGEVIRSVGFEILDLRTLGLPWFRDYHGLPSGWRLRRWVTGHAGVLSAVSALRWKGQTLCCAARRPED
jgi:ubiquinone/menaquinone biosynthesis C-methylase UbiE